MAKDVRLVIGASVDRAEQEIRKLQRTGQDVSDSLGNAFDQLGSRSSMAMEKQRAAAVAAYDRIKNSGVASADEIGRAQTAMQQKISQLDTVLNPLPAKFAAIDKEIAAMAGSGQASTDRLARSFEQLGVRSTKSIEQEKAAAVAAYDRIRNSGVASADEIGRAKTALAAKTKTLDSELKNIKSSSDSLGGSFSNLKTMAVGVMASFGANDLVQASIEMDKIKNTLNATSGANAGGDYKYMRAEVERLGLSLKDTAQDFGKLTASARGTSLEGEQTRKILASTAGASTVLGLSADQTTGILRNFTQMISKGTVQSEELKDAGERLPGMFQMAARAMGLSTAELQKNLETGKVLATDLLPKLAAELEKTYGAQSAAAARSTQAELNRLNTAFFELKAKAADGDTFASFFRAATGAAKLLGDNLDVVKVGLIAIAGSSIISGVGALTARIAAIGTVSAVASAGLYGLAAAAGYALGKGIDKGVYKTTGFDISGNNEYEASQKRLAEAQGRLDQVSEKLRASEVAQNAEKEKASQAQKETEALMVKELALFKAQQDAKSAMSREQKALELATMKSAYDQGLVATEAYYNKEKQIAIAAAEQELATAKEYLAKETALLSNIQGRSKDGKPTAEYVEEQAKHEKAIETVRMAELRLSKTTLDENNKVIAALKGRDEAYLKLEQTALEGSRQYVAAEALKWEAEQRSVEFLRTKQDAIAGVSAAVQALADKEQSAAMATISAIQKERAERRQYADNYAALQDKISEANGIDSAYLSAKSALRDEINKKIEYENTLESARQSGNVAEYNHALRMKAAEDVRIGQLTTELDLKRRAADLSAMGNADLIILNDLLAKGLSEEAFWLQKKIDLRNLESKIQQDQIQYERQIAQAIADGNNELLESLNLAKRITDESNRSTGYGINDRRQSSTMVGNVNNLVGSSNPYSLGSMFTDINAPFMGGLDTGTNRVVANGYAFLHKDEAVVPKQYNPAVGGQSAAQAPVTITGDFHFNLPNFTNQTTARELARMVIPEIQQLMPRFRKTG